MRAENSGS